VMWPSAVWTSAMFPASLVKRTRVVRPRASGVCWIASVPRRSGVVAGVRAGQAMGAQGTVGGASSSEKRVGMRQGVARGRGALPHARAVARACGGDVLDRRVRWREVAFPRAFPRRDAVVVGVPKRGEDGGLNSSEAYALYKAMLSDYIALEATRFPEMQEFYAS